MSVQVKKKVIQLEIGPSVMGNVYVPRVIQILCKQEVKVIPVGMTVFQDDGKPPKQAMVYFTHGSSKYKLALSLFRQPPSVEDLMKVVPFTVKPATQLGAQTNGGRGRFSVFG